MIPCLLAVGGLFTVQAFSLERRRLPGIWRLRSDSLPYEADVRSKLTGLLYDKPPEEVLIKLNPDGSFKQCNEGYNEGRWLAGRWAVNDQERLVLAMRRQYFGPQFDVLLEGNIQETSRLKVEGDVQKGKFMYHAKHPSFFDAPLVNSEALGRFTLEQLVATSALAPVRVRVQDPYEANQFEKADFYDRQFIMTVEPIDDGKRTSGRGEDPRDDIPVDIRAMPIRFFANNTFRALGTNKILRGRFEITEHDELAFEVSLFGMGRSVSGSVYSEGLGLTHEDERCYVGSIDETEGRLRVEGTVTYGADMGSDARPEPVGRFILTETVLSDEDLYFDLADDDYSIFQ